MLEIMGKSNFSLRVKAVVVCFTLVHGHNEGSGDRSREGELQFSNGIYYSGERGGEREREREREIEADVFSAML